MAIQLLAARQCRLSSACGILLVRENVEKGAAIADHAEACLPFRTAMALGERLTLIDAARGLKRGSTNAWCRAH